MQIALRLTVDALCSLKQPCIHASRAFAHGETPLFWQCSCCFTCTRKAFTIIRHTHFHPTSLPLSSFLNSHPLFRCTIWLDLTSSLSLHLHLTTLLASQTSTTILRLRYPTHPPWLAPHPCLECAKTEPMRAHSSISWVTLFRNLSN
jgi:hypothetical protein